ncbi:MAG: hypothetical protein IT427_11020 [Pirellulales bacterium]|nr:hypothetical protein [Pirellulales bacterium]
MTSLATSRTDKSFQWLPQPAAAAFVDRLLAGYVERHPRLRELGNEMLAQTGTRLVDWLDHLVIPSDDSLAVETLHVGYEVADDLETTVFRHVEGMFPPLVVSDRRLHGELTAGVAIKVERLDQFLQIHGLADKIVPTGAAGGKFRTALVDAIDHVSLWIVERHGFAGFALPLESAERIAAAEAHFQQFQSRRREFGDPADGFLYAQHLIQAAQREIGVDWAADRFFAAEREYWQSRNRAAQVQYARQQRLGLGWANHDHHTFRSSRRWFFDLIASLELLGFQCRERFYAGREAGWGAQVLEQRTCGLCVFADVDLSPDEVAGDFAHQPLGERGVLGTVGLWCALHGEAFLEAGMHHLEAQFSFDSAREQLQQADVKSMAPFTDLPYLRQAFTAGERWPVRTQRIDRLLADSKITPEQAHKFRREGAIGSHLEVLERGDGYKGFNQTGISDIIGRTDPRREA